MTCNVRRWPWKPAAGERDRGLLDPELPGIAFAGRGAYLPLELGRRMEARGGAVRRRRGDAVRKLSDRCTHLYTSSTGSWYDLQPNINRTARQLANGFSPETVIEEIEQRLRQDTERNIFHAVHPSPDSTGDVPDETEARLVVLGS